MAEIGNAGIMCRCADVHNARALAGQIFGRNEQEGSRTHDRDRPDPRPRTHRPGVSFAMRAEPELNPGGGAGGV